MIQVFSVLVSAAAFRCAPGPIPASSAASARPCLAHAAPQRSPARVLLSGADALSSDSEAAAAPPLPLLHRPLPQLPLCLGGYLVHVVVLSRRHVRLGAYELGWDTIAGLAVLCGAVTSRARDGRPGVPPWLFGPRAADEAAALHDLSSAPSEEKRRALGTACLLLAAPLAFSRLIGPVADVVLSLLALAGAPLTEARLLPARLILEQTCLYAALCKLLAARHPDFFTRRWVRWSARGPWLAPVLGGYAASLALFNLVEPLNQMLLPPASLLPAGEGLVSRLASPADKSLGSLLLAAAVPVLGAPLFEELQGRAFMLQALSAVARPRAALALSGLLFGAMHLQLPLVLPLAAMGWFWAVLYVQTGNLLVPVAIHALWNGRIFLGSFLGL